MIRNSIIKIISLIVIIGLNWTGLSAIIETFAYLNDTETSSENSYNAGALDFYLSPTGDFSPPVTPGQSSSRTISVINIGNLGFQYNVQASEFSGELCDYLNLEANVDEGDPEYSGSLKTSFATTTFSEPDDWIFTITLPQDNSMDVLEEETCQFKFVFNGWQDNLPSGQGFNDTEEILNNVTAGEWMPNLLTPLDNAVINGSYVKQCWTPVNGATKYIYQSCNNNPNVGLCNERWYVEYPEETPQFTEACKWAPNVGNATYWWRVKAVIDSYTTSYSTAWKITIDNSHSNQVVINEFLPNPVGDDTAPMPDGEWVELYNNKGEDVDVAGWWLYDENDEGELPITISNTNTGDTLIRSGGFLVVYRDGDPDFALDNIGGDTVRLYNGEIGTGTLIDSHTYTINALGGKSFARVPDGSNTWVDPIPTPGEPNTLDGEDMIFEPTFPEPGEEVPEEAVEENITNGNTQEETVVEEETVVSEENTSEETNEEATTEENQAEENQEEGIIDGIVNEIVEEIISDGTINEELTIEGETPMIDETTNIEEAPTNEGTVIEEQPATEEQLATVPDNDSSQNEPVDGSDNTGGSDGSSSDGTATSVDNGSSELTGDSGNNLGE